MASIFRIRLIIFVFGDFCVFKEIFCGNASHSVVAFVSVVAFCGLLWSFVTSQCFCMMVCGATLPWTLPYFVVFVTIIAFMVVQFRICFWWVLSNTVDLACSLEISSPRCFACSVGFFKLMMFRLQFWDAFLIQNFSPAVSRWRLLNSRCFSSEHKLAHDVYLEYECLECNRQCVF